MGVVWTQFPPYISIEQVFGGKLMLTQGELISHSRHRAGLDLPDLLRVGLKEATMRKSVFLTCAILCFFLCCASSVKAQQDTGDISGTVTDKQGAAIAGAQVTITNENTGLKRTVSTNERGAFTASLLPVGTYRILIEAKGFKLGQHTAV